MMDGPIDTAPGRPPTVGPSRCMGCASWRLGQHDCGGDKILTQGLGWRCDCAESECQRRQDGIWPAGPPSTARRRQKSRT